MFRKQCIQKTSFRTMEWESGVPKTKGAGTMHTVWSHLRPHLNLNFEPVYYYYPHICEWHCQRLSTWLNIWYLRPINFNRKYIFVFKNLINPFISIFVLFSMTRMIITVSMKFVKWDNDNAIKISKCFNINIKISLLTFFNLGWYF